MHNVSPDTFQALQKGFAGIRVLLLIGAACMALAALIFYGICHLSAPESSQPVGLQNAAVTITLSPSTAPSPSSSPHPTLLATPTLSPTSTPTAAPTATPEQGEAGIIGYSVEGRPLEVFRFGSGAERRMILAGIHGGYEENTVRLADELINALTENPKIVPADKTLFILRVINPDGLARGAVNEGRSNANGVDLNRNWDAFWQADWQRTGCWTALPISAGTAPFSEPEAQTLAAFLVTEKISALISYHSAGLGVSAGGQPSTANSISLAQSIARATGYSYPPKFTTCQLTGQLIDWAAGQGIAAVDVELNNHAETDLAINLRALKAFLQWEVAALTPAP